MAARTVQINQIHPSSVVDRLDKIFSYWNTVLWADDSDLDPD